MQKKAFTFGSGVGIGALGGLIGLGGAEFRLPLLIGPFRFKALEAILLNKTMSLIVVAAALPFRAAAVPAANIIDRWEVIAILLSGSLAGAWFGAGWATRLKSHMLYKFLAVLLAIIAVALLFGHNAEAGHAALLHGNRLAAAGILAGFGIGVVAALMGVAGGELLIPAIVLLFGVDLKLAGSLSLAVSLPTMLSGFIRYSRDPCFAVIRSHWQFAALMAAGSLVGVYLGGQLLGFIAASLLLPVLAAILMLSAVKLWMQGRSEAVLSS